MTTVGRLSLTDALVRLSHLVQQVFAEVSKGVDLTPQQTQLLCRLAFGPVGMTDLCRALNLEKSSMTGLVDRVQRRGLVARIPDERDRRAFRIELTALGDKLATHTHDAVAARLDALLRELSPEHREVLRTAIPQLLAAGDC